MRARSLLVAIALAAGCSSAPGVDITVVSDASLAPALSAKIVALEFVVSGAEQAHVTRQLGHPWHGSERIVYTTHARGTLDIAVAARDAEGNLVLAGSATVTLTDALASVTVPLQAGTLTANQSTVDFGNLLVGGSPVSVKVAIKNGGTRTTGALAVTLGGANPSAFTLTDGCSGQPLAASATCTLGVSFNPLSPGAVGATVTIAGVPGGSTAVTLTANALTPGVLSVAPSALAFGSIPSGQTSSGLQLTITNSGSTATGALTSSIGGTNATEFVIDQDDCSQLTIAAGGTCTMRLHFAPTAVDDRSATLTIGATPGGNAVIPLTGTGIAPAALAFAPTPYDFGIVDVGTTSASQSFTLTNSGAVATGPLSTSLGGDSTQFTTVSDGCNGQTLAPATSCTVALAFKPLSYGLFGVTLSAAGLPGGSTSATITGTGRVLNTLTVVIAGGGSGTVIAPGLTCTATTCTGQYPRTGTTAPSVAITATPGTGSTLTWSGDSCSGSTGECDVTVDGNKNETATFAVQHVTLTVTTQATGGATGSVASGDSSINCGSSCSATYAYGTNVTLTATPGSNYLFQSWSGDCSGASTTCTVSVTSARNVTAKFRAKINYAFTTSTLYAGGSLGGLSGADLACQTRANAAGLGGTYIALLSTSTVSAVSRLASARGWLRPDGRPFGDTAASVFTNFIIDYPLDMDEFGNYLTFSVAFSGSERDGTYYASNGGGSCGDWTQTGASGIGGPVQLAGAGWFTNYSASCDTASDRLYCFETDYSTPVTATATAGKIIFASKSAFTLSSGIAAADALCTADATAAGLASASTFKAVLTTTTASAQSRFKQQNAGTAVVRPDGILVNLSENDFFSGVQSLGAPSSVADKTYSSTANNIATGAPTTGMTMPGTNDTTCNNWSTAVSTVHFGFGDYDWVTSLSRWYTFLSTCDQTYFHVYCLQDN